MGARVEVGDKVGVLYLGIPPGKKYKNWEVVVEHINPQNESQVAEVDNNDIPF